MKKLYLALTILLVVNPLAIQAQELSRQESLTSVELDFDKVLNLDELEEEMVKMNIIDSIKPIPPHPVIVMIRIIGCPMANAYFAVRRAFRNSVQKITAFFKLKSDSKVHEESSTH